MTGAQAVALLQMVCNLTQGEKFKTIEKDIKQIFDLLSKSRDHFMALKEEDEQAFKSLMDAYRLPKSTDDEKNFRKAKINASLYLAAKAPLGMLEETVRMIPLTAQLLEIGNKNLVTDVGVAIHLLDATIQGARLNILINTRLVDNPALDLECKKIIATAEKLMAAQKAGILEAIDNLLNKR